MGTLIALHPRLTFYYISPESYLNTTTTHRKLYELVYYEFGQFLVCARHKKRKTFRPILTRYVFV